MAPAKVVFQVECQDTKLGESVVAVGSKNELGQWTVEKGLHLETTRESFPVWSSGPIELGECGNVEYKFVVKGPTGVRWEDFPGNRSVTPEANTMLTTTSKWSKCDAPAISKQPLSKAVVATGHVEHPATDDEIVSMSDVLKLAGQIEHREPRRKNFSQSLLSLDVNDVDPGENPQQDATPKPLGDGEEPVPPTPSRHTLPLKHIMSFSALTQMADVDEIEEARAHMDTPPGYLPKNLDVPIVIVTSEIAPYSKTGGLGLVAASYSFEFPRKGHRTMVVSPKYKHYSNLNYVKETKVHVNGNEEIVKYWHKHENGCDYVFVEHPSIEKSGGLYNADDGREYPDNLFRFTLLSLAALEAPLILELNGKTYGQKVMFLANDWQAGLVPLYLCYKFRPNGTYNEARCIYVVHNLGYQGQYPRIPACHFFGINQQAAQDVGLGDCVNLSKGALICSDRVLTVSPNYTKEIQTAAGGFRLEQFVKNKGDQLRLGGILNGIDDCWNPELDKHLVQRYSIKDFEAGKRANKAALQKQLGLEVNDKKVLIGFVGRLTWQKGVDVMVSILEWLMTDGGNGVTGQCQLIMMGNGEKQYADALRWGEQKFPGRVCGYVGFDPTVEHQIMGGCDLFLMPSRYEPCGLPQMYSQRYGTLPIVTATGGLVDSVKDVSLGCDQATGFHMAHLDANMMKKVVYAAAELCLKAPQDFKAMQKTAMAENFYWPKAMDEYEECIDQTLADASISR
mmetsp:Transcript_90138/g.197420  ORF Transcript_90138/g.197420 Transcript_90138/m.197420 type:complete len:736 (+) Transcript_90138:202-2409(+)